MRPDADDFAAIVQAQQFSLIGPTGAEVANLGTTTIGAAAAASLTLRHLDALVGDSALDWTTDTGSSGFETTRLAGPTPTGGSRADAPQVRLATQNTNRQAILTSGNAGASYVQVEQGGSNGVSVVDASTDNFMLTNFPGDGGGLRAGHDTNGVLRSSPSLGVGIERGDYTGPGFSWESVAGVTVEPSHRVLLFSDAEIRISPGAGRLYLTGRPGYVPVGMYQLDMPASVVGFTLITFLINGIAIDLAAGDQVDLSQSMRLSRVGAGGACQVEMVVYAPGGVVTPLKPRLVVNELAVGEDAAYHSSAIYTASSSGVHTFTNVGQAIAGGSYTAIAPDCSLQARVLGIR